MSATRAQVNEIVAELRDLRASLNVPQQEVADAIGVSRGQIGHWETGKQVPSLEHLEKWAAHFALSIRVHVDRDKRVTPEPTTDFATFVGRAATVWHALPDGARRAFNDFMRAFDAMTPKE